MGERRSGFEVQPLTINEGGGALANVADAMAELRRAKLAWAMSQAGRRDLFPIYGSGPDCSQVFPEAVQEVVCEVESRQQRIAEGGRRLDVMAETYRAVVAVATRSFDDLVNDLGGAGVEV
jgi:hypothetical protein